MRICLLTNQDLDDPTFVKTIGRVIRDHFCPTTNGTLQFLEKNTNQLRKSKHSLKKALIYFLTYATGQKTNSTIPGIEVIQTLEKHGVPFTGATSTCYEPTRKEMKDACTKHGIATPKFVFAKNETDVERAAKTLQFPLFVKHHNSYASVDISRASKVMSPAGLKRQAKKIIRKHGAALIEEYIEGIECTVLIAETPGKPNKPTSYIPVQYEFPEGESFKHSDMKFVDYAGLKTFPVPDKKLAKRLQKECSKFFVAMNAESFGRCDIRVNNEGTPYILELNMNCGVYFEPEAYGSADFCISLDEDGHIGFTKLLVESAFSRYRK